MGSINFDPIVRDVSSKVGNFVYSRWKGKNVMKPYTRPTGQPTEKQLEVQRNFKTVTTLWKALTESMKNSWDASVRGKAMIPMNMFMKMNAPLVRSGKPCIITRSTGMEKITGITVTSSAAGTLAVAYPEQQAAPLLSTVLNKVTDDASEPVQIRFDLTTTTTGATIDGLESGAEYFVYVIATDKPFNDSTMMSESEGFRVKVM